MQKFEVESFIWSESFTEKELVQIEKAKNLGFNIIETFNNDPDNYSTVKVKKQSQKGCYRGISATVLGKDAKNQ